jgi:hypothetical protein
MKDSIRDIYLQNISLIRELDRAIIYFRKQQYDKALTIVADSIAGMKTVIEAVVADREYFKLVSDDIVTDMLSGILNAQKKKDFLLLADYLELQMVSFLCSVQEIIISREEIVFDEEKYISNVKRMTAVGEGFTEAEFEAVDTETLLKKGYRAEFTSCGAMTLAAGNGERQYYFHTNGRVFEEAMLLASSWYKEEIGRYIVFGFGMGYHIRELSDIAPESKVEVYETDIGVLKLACAFTGLEEIFLGGRVRVVLDPDLSILKKRLASLAAGEAFRIHYPSLQNIRKRKDREMLASYIPWAKTIES